MKSIPHPTWPQAWIFSFEPRPFSSENSEGQPIVSYPEVELHVGAIVTPSFQPPLSPLFYLLAIVPILDCDF